MKSKFLFVLILIACMASCENASEEFLERTLQPTSTDESLKTRSSDQSSIADSLVEEKATPEMRMLKNNAASPIKRVTPSTNDTEYADLFYSNIYEIREIPLFIQVKNVASNSNSSNNCLECTGAGKEVVLSWKDRDRTSSHKFRLQVLPASSGIPYRIYSCQSGTPLTVGHYNSNPDKKILMSQINSSSFSDMSGWDLIPSSYYKNHFSIQNTLYLGQSDPNSMWSVFNYTLEATDIDKLSFAQPDKNKAQQVFKLIPCEPFNLISIEYDLSSATIHKYIENASGTGSNPTTKNRVVTITYDVPKIESSFYDTSNNIFEVDLKTDGVIHPWVIGGNLQIPTASTRANQTLVPFQTVNQYNYTNKLHYDLKLNCPPKSYISAEISFVKYSVSVKFTATGTYEVKDKSGNITDLRTFKLKGIWRGVVYENPQDIAPVHSEPNIVPIGGEGGPDEPIFP